MTEKQLRIGMGRRGGWLALVGGIAAFGVLEAVVLHLIVEAVAPRSVVLVVDVVAGSLTLLFVVAVASPTWSVHRVTAGALRARFGWLAAANVPLSAIASVTPYQPTVRRPAQLGLDFDEDTGLLSLIRSPSSPLLRVELTTAVAARTQLLQRVSARALLLSTDDPERLRAALLPK
ncbi:hypothetical protein [Nocardia sp. NPDC051832]|uniref:hypothetical protein n=1 Tax=Nocardia sp. NPDC051832 TaxID=3155673 RepID=UPI003444F388